MFTWRTPTSPTRRFSPLLRYRASLTADMRHPRKALKLANIVAVGASVTNAGLSQPPMSSALRIRRCIVPRKIQLRQKPSGWGASVGVQPPTSRQESAKHGPAYLSDAQRRLHSAHFFPAFLLLGACQIRNSSAFSAAR